MAGRRGRIRGVRKVLLAVLLLSLFVASTWRGERALADEGWDITAFDIVYDVQADGAIEATETIHVDFGSLSKHGIFRYFFTKVPCGEPIEGAQQPIYPCPRGDYREYDYDIHSVTRLDGTKWKYEVNSAEGKVTVKIGDGDVFISGEQDYVIRYTVRGALDAYDDHDELYWDASGEWPVSIANFTVTVKLPAGAESRAVCYEGFAGSNARCEASADGSTITYRATRELGENEQVTIVAGWQKGLVEVGPPMLGDRVSIGDFFTFDALEFGGVVGSFVVGVLAVIASWYRFGRDRAYLTIHYLTSETEEQAKPVFGGPPVVVEYVPPEDLRPAQMGVLLDERADTLDVTATIVDLAVRGYLHITELPKKGWFGSNDWKLTKLKEDDGLNAFEKKLFNALFKGGKDEVELSDLKYTFATDLARAKDLIYDDAMKRKWFATKPETARGMWVIVGVAMIVLGVGLSCFAALFIARGLFFLGLIPAGLFMLIVSRSMAHRTAAGSEMLRRVLGFRLYIETAEKHRQEFNEKENIFARYLPFAIVFGSVGKWAKAFEGLEDQAAASTSSWYTGTRPFQAMVFSSSLQNFSSSVGSTLSSTRSSSGGSGFSGGSSGGGGGGGGGGSW